MLNLLPTTTLVSLFSGLALCITTNSAFATIDLVTLPQRDQVHLTIYNASDLTLVREQRTLTLKQGINRLAFSWENTLIDPTSVVLEAPQHKDKVNLLEVSYPPNTQGNAVWTINSQIEGEVPVEIHFFTSGIRWQSLYRATLATDEQTMQLQNYVKVDNRSGEDYSNAHTRVVVGKVQLLDEIAVLARRQPPFGKPSSGLYDQDKMMGMAAPAPMMQEDAEMPKKAMRALAGSVAKPKEIIKEGVSEYFLYSIEGEETIPNGWAKQLQSFDIKNIPIKTLYRYDEQRYSTNTQGFLYFKNTPEQQLGQTPLPDGAIVIYRQLADNYLTYVNNSTVRYIPVGQEVEIPLGATKEVKIEPTLQNVETQNYTFDRAGDVSGFERQETWQLKISNGRTIPVELEIFRYVQNPTWKIENPKELKGTFEKVDVNTFKYRLSLEPTSEYTIAYTLTIIEDLR